MQEMESQGQLAAGAIGVNRNASAWADVFVPWSRPRKQPPLPEIGSSVT